jgi:acetyl-CoA C-acetyltransferase
VHLHDFKALNMQGTLSHTGRHIVLASNLPESVPGTAVDRQCGSSQQAVHFAAQAVMSGTQDVVIAGGVEMMSSVPIGSNVADSEPKGRGIPVSPSIRAKYPHLKTPNFSQFDGAELLAEKADISRKDMEAFAVMSHRRAVEATQKGLFDKEIVPVRGINPKTKEQQMHVKDEGIRPNTSLESLAKLPPLRKSPPGRITAGTASQICDGASAVLICNEAGLKKLGLTPRAKVVALALAGSDPVMMLYGPVPATRHALAKAQMSVHDLDLYEVNEAFACVPLCWVKELRADMDKLNVNGGGTLCACELCFTFFHIIPFSQQCRWATHWVQPVRNCSRRW